jgi:hypothetical protein
LATIIGLNQKDTFFNPFRVKPPEGQMMAVMKSTKDGELDRIVSSVLGWHFLYQEELQHLGIKEDDPEHPRLAHIPEWEKWELLPDVDENDVRHYTPPTMGMPEKEFGIITVGFGKALLVPRVRYAKWEMLEGKVESGLVSKDRNDSPYFFFQYSMGIPVVKVETMGNFEATVRLNVVVRMVNPYKALFLAGGWESLLDGAVNGAVRDYLSRLTIEKVRAEKENGELAKRIMELNGTPNADPQEKKDGFRESFGIEIIEVRFLGFEIEGSKEVKEALEAKEVKKLQAVASRFDAKKINTIGTANAAVAKQMAEAYGSGEAAAQVQAAQLHMEGMIKTNATTIVIGGGNMPVSIPLPNKDNKNKGGNKKPRK